MTDSRRKPYRTSLLLGATLFALQIALSGLAGFTVLSEKVQSLADSAMAALIASPLAWRWIAFYILLGVLTHALPFALAFKMVGDLRIHASPRIRSIAAQRGMAVLLALLLLATMASWSYFLFPRTLQITQTPIGSLLLAIAPAIAFSLVSISAVTLWLFAAASKRAIAFCLALPCILLLAASHFPSPEASRRSDQRPDIIVLGVDSLRPDHLSFNGGPPHVAVTIDEFVSSGVSFNHAYTPMGRTFVAYMSLLSGQYPTAHGVRENLWPRDMYPRDNLLPALLNEYGYTTIYGMDEVRFANVSQDFGFDTIVTPPPGAIELVAGTLMDSVGTNFLQLLPGFDRIAPHIAGNRALIDTYLPSSQNRKLDRAIRGADNDKPLLLVSHFCIAHVPFATGRWKPPLQPAGFEDSPPDYQKALQIADRQIRDTLDSLRREGRLQNAVVILLSDHGEGLGMAKDALRKQGNSFQYPADYGHGTIALSETQSRIVLAMQRFKDGNPTWPPRRVDALASLVDIAPTILGLLNIPSNGRKHQGIRLLDSDGLSMSGAGRSVFVESGIFGQSLQTLDIDPNAVADEFAHLYHLVDDLRFELVPAQIPSLLENKQRGVISGRYGVSSLPQTRRRNCWVLVDYKNNTRACFESPKSHPIVDQYSVLICEHFKDDAAFQSDWCATQKLDAKSMQ